MKSVNKGATLEDSHSDWIYTFDLVTASRTYQLVAFSEEERDIWIGAFNRLMYAHIDQ